ncbi:hypothetical protein ABPG74_007939 [Tetrahymena malaccensis]
MRKRSGALHSTNQEEYLKLAVEQQKQFQDIYSLQQKCSSETFDPYSDDAQSNKKKKPVYELRPYVDLQGTDNFQDKSSQNEDIYAGLDYCSAQSMNQNAIEKQEENEQFKPINTQVINIMIVTEFEEPFVKEIYKLDSFNPTQECPTQNKNKMLDLVIETEQKDQEEKIVFKLWMHNISQSLQSSIHNQIIEEIHYSRCSHFIFLYADGNAKSYNEANIQYEKTKQIKSDNFKATFIGVQTLNSLNQISNLTQIKYSEDDAQEDLPQAKVGKFNRKITVQQNKLTSCIRDLCQLKQRDVKSSSTSSTSSISSTSSTSSSSSLASSFKRQRQNMINSTALSPYHHIIINNQQQLLTQYQDESLQINTIQVNE